MNNRVIETLQFATIGALDPKIEGVLQYHLERARHDCLQRPGDKTKRKVVIELEFEPVMDLDTRECDAINMQVKAHSKMPNHASHTYKLGVDAKRKGLLFDVDSPADIDQPALPFGSNGEQNDERDGDVE